MQKKRSQENNSFEFPSNNLIGSIGVDGRQSGIK